MAQNEFKSGFITLLGLPNAGKSSLLNCVVGEELAIVTPKAQTTWQVLRAFVARPDLELVVVDTPGIQDGTKALNAALCRNTTRALKNAKEGLEVVGFLIDAAEIGRRIKEKKPLGLEMLKEVIERETGKVPLRIPVITGLTKADLVRKPQYRKEIEAAVAPLIAGVFSDVKPPVWISMKSGEGVEAWLTVVKDSLPAGEKSHLFEEDALSDQTLRGFASEYIREQCFMQLGEELPYSIAVEITQFDESDPEIVRIEAALHVERDGQKAIVLGKGGAKIKSIGTKARGKIERIVGKKVYLGLRVKVTPHWAREKQWVERFGYGDLK